MSFITLTLNLAEPLDLAEGERLHLEFDAEVKNGVLTAQAVKVTPGEDDPLERMIELANRVNPGPLSGLSDKDLQEVVAEEMQNRHLNGG
jgi:hypothetical protein